MQNEAVEMLLLSPWMNSDSSKNFHFKNGIVLKIFLKILTAGFD